MCSILGCCNSRLDFDQVEDLNHSLSHRGPDHSRTNTYDLKNKPLFLSHNRLAIQDLNHAANQPMENERYAIVFNGEIYNHMEIRERLARRDFHTWSDTETLLYAFAEWGIERTLASLIGMFAIALFDKYEQKVILIRDRVGIKSLYWTYQKNEFFFASELKGIAGHLKEKVSKRALAKFFSLGYIPGEESYYDGVHKLKPGHYLVFDGENIAIKCYWDLPTKTHELEYDEAVDEVERLVKSSIKYRLLSDLEVGSFLSGGIDSSLVSAVMQEESSQKIKTFSIGFERQEYNEADHAKRLARFIGSEHHEHIFSAKDLLDVMDRYDYYYDEPFGDASSIPMMLLSKNTKKEVTVALSGDGGDELFLGYDRYFFCDKYKRLLSRIPQSLRGIASFLLHHSTHDKLEKMAYPVKHPSMENLFSVIATSLKPWQFNLFFTRDFLLEAFGKENVTLQDILGMPLEGDDTFEMLSRLDFNRYLPDDILTKVDRASMAYSLEARVPLLDHRIVELAYSIPTHIKLKNGPKSILKEVLYRHVPRELVDRPKRGFSVPLKFWFRNELKERVYEKIDSLDGSIFNKDAIWKLTDLHMNHNRNYEYILWNLMRL